MAATDRERMPEPDAGPPLLAILQFNWQAEMEDHATYKTLALAELDAIRRNVMRGLASAEKHHAHLWAAQIAVLGGPEPLYRGMQSGGANSFSSATGGIDAELHQLRAKERSEIERHEQQRPLLPDRTCQRILQAVIADENKHYGMLSALIRARPPLPVMDDYDARAALAALLAARRKQQPQVAGWTNEAIYAAHEGLGSIFGIVSGVAGATFGQSRYVLIAGLTGMMGSALSAGTGAYLTARASGRSTML